MDILMRAADICKDYIMGEVRVQALKHVSFELYRENSS